MFCIRKHFYNRKSTYACKDLFSIFNRPWCMQLINVGTFNNEILSSMNVTQKQVSFFLLQDINCFNLREYVWNRKIEIKRSSLRGGHEHARIDIHLVGIASLDVTNLCAQGKLVSFCCFSRKLTFIAELRVFHTKLKILRCKK